MKLYATVASNRAIKGQGGDYLDIEVKNEKSLVCASFHVENVAGEVLISLSGATPEIMRSLYDNLSEKYTKKCYYCGITPQTEEEYQEAKENWWTCGRPDCSIEEETKGEKKKDEVCSIVGCEVRRIKDGSERYYNGHIVCDYHASKVDGY